MKRFFQARSGGAGRANRYAPEVEEAAAQFRLKSRKAIGPDEQELSENPRARSSKLRVGVRTEAPSTPVDLKTLGLAALMTRDAR